MNVPLRHLRIFLSLAASLNFSRTAEQFFVTQPSLSKSIRDLEAELDLILFERSTRTVRLTAAGTRLIPLAQRMVGEYDMGLQQLRQQSAQEARRLAIAALPSLTATLLPPCCAALQARFAQAHVAIHDGTNAASIQRVAGYQVDFALASAIPQDSALVYEEILRDRFVLMAASAWRPKLSRRMHLADIQAMPLVSMTDQSTAMRDMSAAFARQGLTFRPRLQLDQIGSIAGFVRQGLGVAVLPYLGIMPLLSHQGMTITELVDGPLRSIGIVHRRGTPATGIAQVAMQEVRRVADTFTTQAPRWVLPPAHATARAAGAKPR